MAFLASVIGRMLLGLIFIVSGIAKIMHVSATAELIAKATTLPPSIALPVGIFELVFGVFLAVGFMTRVSSVLLFMLYSLPNFWLATLLIMAFSSELTWNILPSVGLHSIVCERWTGYR